MATTSFMSLTAKVNPSVPGCPLPLIAQHIRDAAIVVCERALVWRYERPEFDLTPGAYSYAYAAPTESRVHALLHATVNGTKANIVPMEEALRIFPAWTRVSTTAEDIALYGSTPHTFTNVAPNRFVVLPAPDAAQTYSVRMICALKPTTTASGMDSDVLADIEDIVVHKALQELLVLPTAAWSDKQLATYHAKQFLAGLMEHRANINIGRQRGSLAVQQRPLA